MDKNLMEENLRKLQGVMDNGLESFLKTPLPQIAFQQRLELYDQYSRKIKTHFQFLENEIIVEKPYPEKIYFFHGSSKSYKIQARKSCRIMQYFCKIFQDLAKFFQKMQSF